MVSLCVFFSLVVINFLFERSGKTLFFFKYWEKNQALHPPKYLEQITCLEFVLVFTGFAKQGIILHSFCNDLQIICLKKRAVCKKMVLVVYNSH